MSTQICRQDAMLIILLLVAFTALKAQRKVVLVKLVDSASHEPVPMAIIKYGSIFTKDTLLSLSNEKGQFVFKTGHIDSFFICVSHIGYRSICHTYSTSSDEPLILSMAPAALDLQEVVVEADPVTIKKDTVEYRSETFKVKENATVEDLLKRLPGVQVARDGSIIAQGKQVTKIKVNGRVFFSGDPQVATKNLPADMISKVQVIDESSDQAKFSGFDDNEREKVINLVLKSDKHTGYFGRLTAAAGPGDYYNANVFANYFSGKHQLSLVTNVNNINSMLLPSNNMLGGLNRLIKQGNMTVDNFGGINSFSTIVNNNDIGFLTSSHINNNGINESRFSGLNYNSRLSKRLIAYGSYLYSGNTSHLYQTLERKIILPDSFYYYNEDKSNLSPLSTQRLYCNVEYKLDSATSLKATVTVNDQENRSDDESIFRVLDQQKTPTIIGRRNNGFNTHSQGAIADLLYKHRFARRGRTFSADFSFAYNHVGQENYLQSLQTRQQGTNVDSLNQEWLLAGTNRNASMRFSYTAPINKTMLLELIYNFTGSQSGSDKNAYDTHNATRIFQPLLSNLFWNSFNTSQAGLNIKRIAKKYSYIIGASIAPSSLSWHSVSPDSIHHVSFTGLNILPQFTFNYGSESDNHLSIRYFKSIHPPSTSQLQPVQDISDNLFIRSGNSSLRPEYYNTVDISYNKFSLVSGQAFFSRLAVNVVQDKIGSSIYVKQASGQVSTFINVSGYYSVNGFYYFSKPYHNSTYVLSMNGTVTYIRDVNEVQFVRNYDHNWILSQGCMMEYCKRWIESSVGVTYRFNDNHYTLKTHSLSAYSLLVVEHSSRFDFGKAYNLKYDLAYKMNTGLGKDIQKNVFNLNMSLERGIFHNRGTIKLEVRDILNSNVDFARNGVGSYIENIRTATLRRYFLLSAKWKFERFSGPPSRISINSDR